MTDRTDDFTRADTTNAIGTPSDSGSAWSQLAGTWGILSNKGYTSSAPSQSTCVLEASVASVTVQATQATVSSSSDSGLLARVADNSNYLLFSFGSAGVSQYFIYKKVAGSFTQLATASGNIASGDVLKMTVDGANLITGYNNGVSKLSATDSAGSANTKHGIRCNDGNTGGRWATFSITALGGDELMAQALL